MVRLQNKKIGSPIMNYSKIEGTKNMRKSKTETADTGIWYGIFYSRYQISASKNEN